MQLKGEEKHRLCSEGVMMGSQAISKYKNSNQESGMPEAMQVKKIKKVFGAYRRDKSKT